MGAETCYRAPGCPCSACSLQQPYREPKIAIISVPVSEYERLLEKARLWDELGQPVREVPDGRKV